VRSAFTGDVLVLTPSYDIAELLPQPGTVQTVAHLERLRRPPRQPTIDGLVGAGGRGGGEGWRGARWWGFSGSWS